MMALLQNKLWTQIMARRHNNDSGSLMARRHNNDSGSQSKF